MIVAAIHIEDDRFGAVEDFFVLRPAVTNHDRSNPRRLLEQVHEQGAAGEELVIAWAMALPTRDEHNLGQLRVGRLLLKRHTGLIERIDIGSERQRGNGDEWQRQETMFETHGRLSLVTIKR